MQCRVSVLPWHTPFFGEAVLCRSIIAVSCAYGKWHNCIGRNRSGWHILLQLIVSSEHSLKELPEVRRPLFRKLVANLRGPYSRQTLGTGHILKGFLSYNKHHKAVEDLVVLGNSSEDLSTNHGSLLLLFWYHAMQTSRAARFQKHIKTLEETLQTDWSRLFLSYVTCHQYWGFYFVNQLWPQFMLLLTTKHAVNGLCWSLVEKI